MTNQPTTDAALIEELRLVATKGIKGWPHELFARAADRLTEAEGRAERLEAALTPSSETKAAYMGEFQFTFDEFTPNVPWTTIKEIMAAIRARAALKETAQ